MYLHVGSGKNVRKKRIIGIFDMDSSTFSPITRDFLSTAEKRGRTEYESGELPRSFLLLENGKYDHIIFSKISTAGLKSRYDVGMDESEKETDPADSRR